MKKSGLRRLGTRFLNFYRADTAIKDAGSASGFARFRASALETWQNKGNEKLPQGWPEAIFLKAKNGKKYTEPKRGTFFRRTW
jgi:hypothetical protein